jgi:putative transposase
MFENIHTVQIVLDSLKFLIENQRPSLHGWIIMENQMHLTASAADFSKEMHNFKSFTASRVIDFFEKNHFNSIADKFMIFKKATRYIKNINFGRREPI